MSPLTTPDGQSAPLPTAVRGFFSGSQRAGEDPGQPFPHLDFSIGEPAQRDHTIEEHS